MSTNAPTALADGNNDVHEQHPVQRAADDDDFITNNISESAKSNSSKKKKRIHKKPMTPQEKLEIINLKLKELRVQREEMSRFSEWGRKPKSTPTDYSRFPKKNFHHPKIDYVVGEMEYSPYRVSPKVGYTQSTLRINEKTRELKNQGVDFLEIPDEEKPYDLEVCRKAFVKDVVEFSPVANGPAMKYPYTDPHWNVLAPSPGIVHASTSISPTGKLSRVGLCKSSPKKSKIHTEASQPSSSGSAAAMIGAEGSDNLDEEIALDESKIRTKPQQLHSRPSSSKGGSSKGDIVHAGPERVKPQQRPASAAGGVRSSAGHWAQGSGCGDAAFAGSNTSSDARQFFSLEDSIEIDPSSDFKNIHFTSAAGVGGQGDGHYAQEYGSRDDVDDPAIEFRLMGESTISGVPYRDVGGSSSTVRGGGRTGGGDVSGGRRGGGDGESSARPSKQHGTVEDMAGSWVSNSTADAGAGASVRRNTWRNADRGQHDGSGNGKSRRLLATPEQQPKHIRQPRRQSEREALVQTGSRPTSAAPASSRPTSAKPRSGMLAGCAGRQARGSNRPASARPTSAAAAPISSSISTTTRRAAQDGGRDGGAAAAGAGARRPQSAAPGGGRAKGKLRPRSAAAATAPHGSSSSGAGGGGGEGGGGEEKGVLSQGQHRTETGEGLSDVAEFHPTLSRVNSWVADDDAGIGEHADGFAYGIDGAVGGNVDRSREQGGNRDRGDGTIGDIAHADDYENDFEDGEDGGGCDSGTGTGHGQQIQKQLSQQYSSTVVEAINIDTSEYSPAHPTSDSTAAETYSPAHGPYGPYGPFVLCHSSASSACEDPSPRAQQQEQQQEHQYYDDFESDELLKTTELTRVVYPGPEKGSRSGVAASPAGPSQQTDYSADVDIYKDDFEDIVASGAS